MPRAMTHRSAADLVAAGLAPPEALVQLEQVAARYAVSLTSDLGELIDPADRHDPIARQFVPDPAELDRLAEETADPIGDDANSPVEGIVHRYPDRVLLKLAYVCAVYCRFCFRREMVGPGRRRALSGAALAAALGYIREHQEIWEVILTGGDPLILSARRLREVMDALALIDHVKVVRIHTRVPIAAPARITPALARALKSFGKAIYVVLHVNHPRELTPAARAACGRLIDAGIPMLSQSVLLRGVNDDPATLAALMREMHGRVSGLCQPAYVLDIPGGHGKSPIGPSYVSSASSAAPAAGRFEVEDFKGGRHIYPPGAAGE